MSIFREYDIRGVYGSALTEPIAEAIGKGFGTFILRSGGKRISLGHDIRLSTPSLRGALLSGLLSTGMDVMDIGVCHTPALYFSLFHLPVDGGMMITASHNPAEFNGFKLCRGKISLYGDDIQKIRRMIEQQDYAHGRGELSYAASFLTVYRDYFFTHFDRFRSKKVVVDCGNGAAGLIAPEILSGLGCEIIPLYCEPDGRFPNHHPDPSVEKNMVDLIAHVKKHRADVGIAFDGDADRLGAVDEKGTILWGDQLTLLFAADILKKQPGATILSEVKASQIFYDEVERLGGRAIMWKAGHSLIKAKMRETGALLAGEMSGHIFFADRFFGYDDAVYAACRLIEILDQSDRPLSSHFAHLPKSLSTPEIRLDCPDEKKFDVADACRVYFSERYKTVTVDGVRVLFEGGWALVRASNTQPALTLRFEATTPERLVQIQEEVHAFLDRVIC